jgi:hypothetical protein
LKGPLLDYLEDQLLELEFITRVTFTDTNHKQLKVDLVVSEVCEFHRYLEVMEVITSNLPRGLDVELNIEVGNKSILNRLKGVFGKWTK